MPEEDIAQVMGISQQRVNQVLIRLLGASKFISDKNKVKEAIRLFLQGMSHRKMWFKGPERGAAVVGVDRSTIGDWEGGRIYHDCNQGSARPCRLFPKWRIKPQASWHR